MLVMEAPLCLQLAFTSSLESLGKEASQYSTVATGNQLEEVKADISWEGGCACPIATWPVA